MQIFLNGPGDSVLALDNSMDISSEIGSRTLTIYTQPQAGHDSDVAAIILYQGKNNYNAKQLAADFLSPLSITVKRKQESYRMAKSL